MKENVKASVSKYVSYLLRHNPEDLKMNQDGFVDLDELVAKVRRRYPEMNKKLLTRIVNESERKRFEMVENKVRALYGHTIPVHIRLEEDKQIARLYHGTTPEAAGEILEKGLQPMRRRWVHLSPTEEIAREVGKRRTDNPLILEIEVAEARSQGTKFYKATDKVYVCKHVPAKYIITLQV